MTVIESSFDDPDLLDAWKSINDSLATTRINFFQSVDWNRNWWLYYGEPNHKYELSLLLVRDDSGVAVAIAPLFYAVKKFAGIELWRRVHWIGYKLTPYPDLIVREGREAEVWQAVLDYINQQHSSAWFELGAIRKAHSLHHARLENYKLERKEDEHYLSVDVEDRKGSDDWCLKQGKRSLKNWSEPDYQWSFVNGYDADIQSTLVSLNIKRFGDASFFSDPVNKEFYDTLLAQSSDACWHTVIRYKKTIVSINSGFISANTLHYFISGTTRDFEVGIMRLGAMNLYFMFKNMLSLGYRHFDFLRGEEQYKLAYSPDVEVSEEWIISPEAVRVRPALARALRRFRKAI
jgi:GNAT acetyltransferase-like protein